jgi:hypothetical protein
LAAIKTGSYVVFFFLFFWVTRDWAISIVNDEEPRT